VGAWKEGHEKSFRAVSTGTDPIMYPQWRGLEIIFQGEAEWFTLEDAQVELHPSEQEIVQAP